MTESSAPLRATLKAGGGYEVPWITVEADNPNDLEQKLRGIIDSKVLETVAEAASQFQATQNATPLTQPVPPSPAQQASAPEWSQAPAQQAPPQQQSQGWGAAQQQSAPQQHGGGQGQFGAQLHPEGKQCQCGQVLEFKKTGSGKGVWRCGSWRWNNGNPTPNHDQDWA